MDTNNKNDNWKSETLSQSRQRLRRAWGDYPLTILIINPINLYLVRLVGHTSITPNQLTFLSFLFTSIAAFCFALVNLNLQAVAGAFLLLGYLIDCLDGDLARLKDLKSPLGAMLDPILNRCGEIIIILGISANGWFVTNSPLWLIGGLILLGMSQLYFYITDAMLNIYRKQSGQLENLNRKKLFGTPVRFGAIEPFIWGQAFLALAGVVYWGVPIFSIMFLIGCIFQLYKIFSITRKNKRKGIEDFDIHVW